MADFRSRKRLAAQWSVWSYKQVKKVKGTVIHLRVATTLSTQIIKAETASA